MKIYMLGNIDEYADEAQKNITRNLYSELLWKHEVKYENARANLFSIGFWREISTFNPDIIHIFLRPTLQVLCYSILLKTLCRNTKIVVSAFQPPQIPPSFRSLFRFAGPHLFITLSNSLKKVLGEFNVRTRVLRCGVDPRKCTPVGYDFKLLLRKKYSVPSETYVILHVGHATKGRNLEVLKAIMDEAIQVIIVSSPAFGMEKDLLEDLKQAGCTVFGEYLEHIEECYQLADCYVFPTQNEDNAVSLPLSILEAMSCNLPIITTKFGALPELFEQDDSFVYFDGTSVDLAEKVGKMRASKRTSSNRLKVSDFDWTTAGKNLEAIYQELIAESGS